MKHMKPVPDRMPRQRIAAIVALVATVVVVVGVLVFTTIGCSRGTGSTTKSGNSNSSNATTSQTQDSSKTQKQKTAPTASNDDTQTQTQAEPEQPSQQQPAESSDPTQTPAQDATALTSSLQASCDELGASSPMTTGIAVRDLKTGAEASYNGDTPMVAASMIKLIVAEAFLEQVQAGTYSLDDTYTLQPEDIVGGTGTLQGSGAGATVTYRELLERMIDVSDNVAANVLINAVGMSAVNASAQRLGLTGTQLNRLMMDTDAIAAGIENYTTANDVAKLLAMVYDGTFVDASSSELMMNVLKAQQDHSGIQDGLPADVTLAHKTGTLSNALHCGGIALCDNPYVIVVLCGGEGFTTDGASAVMANVASVIHDNIAAAH